MESKTTYNTPGESFKTLKEALNDCKERGLEPSLFLTIAL